MTGLCDAVHNKSHKGIQGRGDILLCKHDPCQMSVTPTCIVFGLHAFLRLFYSIYIYIYIYRIQLVDAQLPIYSSLTFAINSVLLLIEPLGTYFSEISAIILKL